MAKKIHLKSVLAYKEDTLSRWQAQNPVLHRGEVSFVRDGEDGCWLKIGDGVTPWNNLPYKLGPKGKDGVDAVSDAVNFKLLYSTEITQEAFDEAGEDGITLITLGDSSIDLTPYNEILVNITVPDSSAINTEANMLYICVTSNSSYGAGDGNVWLRPQSLGIAENCQLNTTYNKFAISGFWHNDSFLYGIIARNGYRGSLGYASGVDGWTTVADNSFKKSEKHYFHIFGSKNTFKFPVGTKVIVYGR